MSGYSELIKNFERIRAYMREFYVYGFKSREGYTKKSARTYDDERRRMESWLGEHMSYVRTADGKNVYISIDSRVSEHNPFYKAWKAKSFTDGDITLHFIIFDILSSPDVEYSLPELIEKIDSDYLSGFDEPMVYDESTLRKKLKEYSEIGIIKSRKAGKRLLYSRTDDCGISPSTDALDFYSEIAPCGVVGSFLLDRAEEHSSSFDFKHHYITGALDMGVLAMLFDAMRQKRIVSVANHNRRRDEPRRTRLIPLRIFVSVQNGRQHLVAYSPESNSIIPYRLDYLSAVKLEEVTPRFDELRESLDKMQENMWGVNIRHSKYRDQVLEHVEFTVRIEPNEEYIKKRLYREKRCGTVEKIDNVTYRFSADVYDTTEIIPWIRTFICRIERLNFSNRTVENHFKNDLLEMYKQYGLTGGEEK